MADHDDRPSAGEMLERVRREAGAGARGRHRVYLGMAPGVGKTYTALEELHRRRERGTDVAIGFVETYNRPLTVQLIGDLELIPRRQVAYKGVVLEEMDTDAIIQRHPAVALVDELAHTNAPGSKHEKRWQDAIELLDNGITVISTVNVQHMESLADLVETITGVKVRERIPDSVLDDADEVELVDVTPHALRQRIRHGNVYPPDRADRALEGFFREGNLMALREMALRKVAGEVEQDLEEYMRQHDVDTVWPAGERVMVCIDDQPRSQNLVRRAWRRARRSQGDRLIGVVTGDDIADVIDQEATEDMYRMAGIGVKERATSPMLESARRRVPWLAFNMAWSLGSAFLISAFQDTIEKAAVLAVFMPVIAGQAGNAGIQTATIVIRSLALGEVSPKDTMSVLLREWGVGLIKGGAFGLTLGLIAWLWKGSAILGVIAGIALFLNISIVASTTGVLLPMTLRRLGIDPATIADVFDTMLSDLMGNLIYLGLATLLLRWLL